MFVFGGKIKSIGSTSSSGNAKDNRARIGLSQNGLSLPKNSSASLFSSRKVVGSNRVSIGTSVLEGIGWFGVRRGIKGAEINSFFDFSKADS